MVQVRDVFNRFPDNMVLLSGDSGIHKQADDVLFFNRDTVFTQRIDIHNKLVFVHSELVLPYSSNFDVLLKTLHQSGAAGVLFQGAKTSDFSHATMLLAEKLQIPLVWVDSCVTYADVVRAFDALTQQSEEQSQVVIHKAKSRLEDAANKGFSLSSWFEFVEKELDVAVDFSAAKDKGPQVSRWITNREGRRQLLIPISLWDETYHLRITPAERCSLYQEAAEELWMDMLAGMLSMQTVRLMLMEIPGISIQQQWMMSFEHGLFAKISELPMMRQSSTYFSGLAHSDTRYVHSLAMLWLTWHSPNVRWHEVDTTAMLRRMPLAYRQFQLTTLYVHHNTLSLLRHSKYDNGTRADLLSCVPWRDWRNKEGMVVFWFGGGDANPSDDVIQQLVKQLESQVGFQVRASLYRRSVDDIENSQRLLSYLAPVLEETFHKFSRANTAVQEVHVNERDEHFESLIASNPQEVVGMLEPILRNKKRDLLLQALETYLECGGKVQVAADRLFLHRNTLRYRLNRVQQLLEIDLKDAEKRLTFQLAIRMWRARKA